MANIYTFKLKTKANVGITTVGIYTTKFSRYIHGVIGQLAVILPEDQSIVGVGYYIIVRETSNH